jgi:phosphotransferase system enzyme I (PtsI)
MAEVRLTGRPAAAGFAAGTLVALPRKDATDRVSTGDPEREEAALRDAIGLSLEDVARLADESEGEAADILSFQLAMLSDEELYRGALVAIAEGQSAHEAWAEALDGEIAGYENSEDEYFRARSADLVDIRDRVSCHLAGTTAGGGLPRGALVVADDLPPSRFLATDWSGGGAILLAHGSPTSHVAMLARSRGVPMIVGLGATILAASGEALVDGDGGAVVVEPSPATRAAFAARRAEEDTVAARAATSLRDPAVTADGTPIAIHLNIADPSELDGLDPAICDGIGLVRTEFLFHAGRGLPGEEAQTAVYRKILDWAGGRPVTIRTLDAGGDKPIAGLTVAGESNPFLGVRGIRLSLARPEVFRLQLRALLRAAAHGPLKVMLPMVTVPQEIEAVRALLAEEAAALSAAGVAVGSPALGIMVEVPAAAIAIDRFDAAAFFSIGSNDLTQYVTAAGRDIGAVADLADTRHPAVLRLIEAVARHGAETGREVSLCGDAGGDVRLIPALLGAGLRSLSMAPGAVPRAKLAIAGFDLGRPGAVA